MLQYLHLLVAERLRSEEDGQTMVEYALVLGFVVAVAAIALVATGSLGGAIDGALEAVGDAL